MPGTSMATPHVATAVADLIAYFRANNISYTNQDIIAILQNSAKQLSNNCNERGCVSGKTLDANAALNYAINNNPPYYRTGGTGGGCSFLQGANDSSILVLLFIWVIILFRKIYVKIGN